MLFGNPIAIAQGPAGVPAYLYLGFASDDIGTDFATSPAVGLDFIAFKMSYTVLTPVVGDFSGLWFEYKGYQGIQGVKGDKGDNTYTYIAWADADDGTGFVTVFNVSKQYFAIKVSNTVLTPVVGDFAGLWKNYGFDIAAAIQASSNKSAIADADKIGYRDNVGGTFVHILWSELKTAISSWMHGLSAKITLADNDEFNIFNSASSYSHEKITWAYVKVAIETWIHGVTTKSTPSDGDEIRFLDSGASYVSKKFTWAELKAALKAAIKINEWAAPTTALAMNSQKITGLAAPTGVGEAARYDEACYPSLTELTTVLSTAKIPVHDGAYKYATRQNLLMGIAGGINFVLNGNFEGDTVGQVPTGWVRYADAAGTSPVDGTGGSPNITFLASDTVILSGTKSARFTKDAANRQGEGISYDMAIPAGYRGKVNVIKFPYIPVDTIATGDFVVWLYDVTNSVLIQPTPYQVAGASAGVACDFFSEVQIPYNCASLRVIWHTATTSTSQLRVDIDEIQVGPGTANQGSPIIELGSLPFTCVGVPGTVVTKCMRVGCDLLVFFAVSITDVGSGIFYLVMPAGYVIDVSKCASRYHQIIGSANAEDASDSWTKYGGNIALNGTNNQVRITSLNGVSTDWFTTSPITWANGDNIRGFFRVPILGWGSNCQMSSDAETRVVAAHCYLSGNANVAPNVSSVKVPLNISSDDTHGGFDAANNRYIVKVPGKYTVNFKVATNGTNSLANYYWIDLRKSGTAIRRGEHRKIASAGELWGLVGSASSIDCVAGDYFEIWITGAGDNSTNQLTIEAGTVTYMDVSRIAGPAQIAASEKIFAQYSTDAALSLATGVNTLIDFEDKTNDSHGCVTTGAAWKFTAPRAGLYIITAKITFAANATGERSWSLYKNGVNVEEGPNLNNNGASLWVRCSGSTQIYLNAGDYLQIYGNQSSGGNLALIASGAINFIKIVSFG